MPYYGLASGFLSGKYRSASDWDGSSRTHALKQAAAGNSWQILAVVREIAVELGVTPAQVSLAWLNAQPDIAAPIASATSAEQLSNLLGASAIRLTTEQIRQLNARWGN